MYKRKHPFKKGDKVILVKDIKQSVGRGTFIMKKGVDIGIIIKRDYGIYITDFYPSLDNFAMSVRIGVSSGFLRLATRDEIIMEEL